MNENTIFCNKDLNIGDLIKLTARDDKEFQQTVAGYLNNLTEDSYIISPSPTRESNGSIRQYTPKDIKKGKVQEVLYKNVSTITMLEKYKN